MSHESHEDEPEPTEEELRAAADLARALDAREAAPGSDAAFAEALRASVGRGPAIDVATRDEVIARALQRGAAQGRARARGRWLAVAAAALLAISLPLGWMIRRGPEATPAPRVFGGPTDALFAAPFPDGQRASERMDRIATTRAHDYFSALAAVGR